jgi:hypothetical protein
MPIALNLGLEAFCFALGPVTSGHTTVHTEYQITVNEFNVKEKFIHTGFIVA